jgi:hypothetical protein
MKRKGNETQTQARETLKQDILSYCYGTEGLNGA